eukprot:scaffold8410_cov220-Pinguiococcus_pyrenoidosus.AAC.2
MSRLGRPVRWLTPMGRSAGDLSRGLNGTKPKAPEARSSAAESAKARRVMSPFGMSEKNSRQEGGEVAVRGHVGVLRSRRLTCERQLPTAKAKRTGKEDPSDFKVFRTSMSEATDLDFRQA